MASCNSEDPTFQKADTISYRVRNRVRVFFS